MASMLASSLGGDIDTDGAAVTAAVPPVDAATEARQDVHRERMLRALTVAAERGAASDAAAAGGVIDISAPNSPSAATSRSTTATDEGEKDEDTSTSSGRQLVVPTASGLPPSFSRQSSGSIQPPSISPSASSSGRGDRSRTSRRRSGIDAGPDADFFDSAATRSHMPRSSGGSIAPSRSRQRRPPRAINLKPTTLGEAKAALKVANEEIIAARADTASVEVERDTAVSRAKVTKEALTAANRTLASRYLPKEHELTVEDMSTRLRTARRRTADAVDSMRAMRADLTAVRVAFLDEEKAHGKTKAELDEALADGVRLREELAALTTTLEEECVAHANSRELIVKAEESAARWEAEALATAEREADLGRQKSRLEGLLTAATASLATTTARLDQQVAATEAATADAATLRDRADGSEADFEALRQDTAATRHRLEAAVVAASAEAASAAERAAVAERAAARVRADRDGLTSRLPAAEAARDAAEKRALGFEEEVVALRTRVARARDAATTARKEAEASRLASNRSLQRADAAAAVARSVETRLEAARREATGLRRRATDAEAAAARAKELETSLRTRVLRNEELARDVAQKRTVLQRRIDEMHPTRSPTAVSTAAVVRLGVDKPAARMPGRARRLSGASPAAMSASGSSASPSGATPRRPPSSHAYPSRSPSQSPVPSTPATSPPPPVRRLASTGTSADGPNTSPPPPVRRLASTGTSADGPTTSPPLPVRRLASTSTNVDEPTTSPPLPVRRLASTSTNVDEPTTSPPLPVRRLESTGANADGAESREDEKS